MFSEQNGVLLLINSVRLCHMLVLSICSGIYMWYTYFSHTCVHNSLFFKFICWAFCPCTVYPFLFNYIKSNGEKKSHSLYVCTNMANKADSNSAKLHCLILSTNLYLSSVSFRGKLVLFLLHHICYMVSYFVDSKFTFIIIR